MGVGRKWLWMWGFLFVFLPEVILGQTKVSKILNIGGVTFYLISLQGERRRMSVLMKSLYRQRTPLCRVCHEGGDKLMWDHEEPHCPGT